LLEEFTIFPLQYAVNICHHSCGNNKSNNWELADVGIHFCMDCL